MERKEGQKTEKIRKPDIVGKRRDGVTVDIFVAQNEETGMFTASGHIRTEAGYSDAQFSATSRTRELALYTIGGTIGDRSITNRFDPTRVSPVIDSSQSNIDWMVD